MQAVRIAFGVTLLVATSAMALAQSNAGVSLIENPGGGTIATAQMPAQHTVQGAMGKVLVYVRNRFGGRPQIARVLRGADGKSLAVIFTVQPTKEASQEIAGLALVAVSESGPAKGAVLEDRADRFRTTVKPMLERLFSRPGASATAVTAVPAAATSKTPVTSVAPAPAPAASAAGSTAASSPLPAGLHRTAFPDNSGIIALPEGWKITAAHAGEVIAAGPAQEALHFDWQLTAIDLHTPAGRRLLASIGGRLGGNFDIPYGSDAATSFKAALTQVIQKQNKTPPSIDVVSSKLQSQQQGPSTYLVEANIGATDGVGAARTWAQVTIWPPNNYGSYLIILNLIKIPQQISLSSATVTAMFNSYGVNNAVALSQLASDHHQAQQAVDAQLAVNRQQQAASDRQFADYQRRQDVQDRQFQAFDNDLLDRTVVRDTDLNGHGTVSNDLADALIDANPNRFQEVPPSEYVKGIDY